MTLFLSHGPWSITRIEPVNARPAFEARYTFNDSAQVDSTYRWVWQGQTLAGAEDNCTFSFSSQEGDYPSLASPIAWGPSVAQRSWYELAKADSVEPQPSGDPDYMQIELSALYCWESDSKEGGIQETGT